MVVSVSLSSEGKAFGLATVRKEQRICKNPGGSVPKTPKTFHTLIGEIAIANSLLVESDPTKS